MKEELWRTIKNFPKYEVSNSGQVRSYQMGYLHLLKPGKNWRYSHINLWKNNKCYTKMIHILVLETFIGSRSDGFVANHKDGVKMNNCIDNLEWITKSDDAKHAFKLGLHKPWQTQGEKTSNAKLKDGEVWLIKRLLWFEWPGKAIAKMFKVQPATISNINTGKNWHHIKFVPTDKDRKHYEENF
ncbi:MAG: HNH endonuclease [Erysipelotrichaceae bacterium]|nr:HNH endonuclease [Erysipelotrichaceae bacterium]